MRILSARFALGAAFLCFFSALLCAKNYAISIDGNLKYPKNFTHFEYANPHAPKGGVLKAHAVGSFDSLNNFSLKGAKAEGLALIYDTLTVQSKDEPFSEYGLLAREIELCADRKCVIFWLNPNARFHDGERVKASDVKFSFEILMKHGNPLLKQYYADVSEVLVLSNEAIRFNFKNAENRELPLILGQLSILPEHFYKDKDFNDPLLVPLGSGAYRIKRFEVGRKIEYERVRDYWAQNHPTRRGIFNFDSVIYEYFKDENVALIAFKSGAFDFKLENSAKIWAQGLDGKALQSGRMKKARFRHFLPSGMQGFFLNTRREIFSDINLRRALQYAFDFEWSNRNLFFSQYTRTRSFFDNSIFAARGALKDSRDLDLEDSRDSSADLADSSDLRDLDSRDLSDSDSPDSRTLRALEREILLKIGAPSHILDSSFSLPSFKNAKEKRESMLAAQKILQDLGYFYRDGALFSPHGKRVEFEILLISKAMERVALPFIANLKLLGIAAHARTIDLGSYINRVNNFDFDVIVAVIPQSLFPGNEQRYFWSSQSADVPGSRNFAGIKDARIDALIEQIISARDANAQIAATRALDRMLLWGFYVIPHFHAREFRVAYFDKFAFPKISPKYDFDIFTWWAKSAESGDLDSSESRESALESAESRESALDSRKSHESKKAI